MRDYLEFFSKVNLEQNKRLFRILDQVPPALLTQEHKAMQGGSVLGALKFMVENACFTQADLCPVPSAEFHSFAAPYLTVEGKINEGIALESYDAVKTALLTLSESFVKGFSICEEKEILGDTFPTYDFLSKGLFMAMNVRGQIIYALAENNLTDLEKQFAGPLIHFPGVDF